MSESKKSNKAETFKGEVVVAFSVGSGKKKKLYNPGDSIVLKTKESYDYLITNRKIK